MNPLGVIAAIGGVGALLMAFRQARRTRPPGGLPTAADGELGRANAAAARAMSVLRQENRAMAQQSRVKSVVPQGGTAFLVTIATPTGEIDVLSDLGIGGAGQKVVAFRSNGMALEADGTVRPMRR